MAAHFLRLKLNKYLFLKRIFHIMLLNKKKLIEIFEVFIE